MGNRRQMQKKASESELKKDTPNYVPSFSAFVVSFFLSSSSFPPNSFTLCTFNKSEECHFDLSLTKLWMISVKRSKQEKRFERQSRGNEALINLSIGCCLID